MYVIRTVACTYCSSAVSLPEPPFPTCSDVYVHTYTCRAGSHRCAETRETMTGLDSLDPIRSDLMSCPCLVCFSACKTTSLGPGRQLPRALTWIGWSLFFFSLSSCPACPDNSPASGPQVRHTSRLNPTFWPRPPPVPISCYNVQALPAPKRSTFLLPVGQSTMGRFHGLCGCNSPSTTHWLATATHNNLRREGGTIEVLVILGRANNRAQIPSPPVQVQCPTIKLVCTYITPCVHTPVCGTHPHILVHS